MESYRRLRRQSRYRAPGLFRQSEIQQLDPLLRDQNVGGLQIAMYDAFAVSRVESIQNLPRVFQRFLHRQRTLKRLYG